MSSWEDKRVYTIGHSTRSLDELVRILRAFDVAVLVDIRTVPRSRHNPQFNRDTLPTSLRSRRPRYLHLSELGGLRRPRKDSPNAAWRNLSFRGYADYMQTEDFEHGLDKLLAVTSKGPIALMCAEAVPWRCHRSLVADALTVRGARVEHITSADRANAHRITPFAKLEGTRVTYPPESGAEEKLPTRAPFHLEATVRVLQRRPTHRVDRWADGRYLRAFETAEGLVLVEVVNHGTIDAPDVRMRVLQGEPSTATRAMLRVTVSNMLGLAFEPKPVQKLMEAESKLASVASGLRGMRPPRFAALFEAFASVIPFQQVSLDAGVAVVGRLIERFGASLEHEAQKFFAFPSAATIARSKVQTLRACGLSTRKADALRHVARAIESGEVSEEAIGAMRSADAIQHLSELPAIGPWSAALILLRGLRRLDVFPPGDVGVARGLSAILHVSPEAAVERVIERFGEKRGYLYFCALGGALLEKGLIQPAPERPPSKRR